MGRSSRQLVTREEIRRTIMDIEIYHQRRTRGIFYFYTYNKKKNKS